jgi:site-specific DNA recombinase
MMPTYTKRNGNKLYRYYVCVKAQKRGWSTCPSKSIPAGEIERFVVDHIRGVGRNPKVVAETVAQARKQIQDATAALEAEQKRLKQEIVDCDKAASRLACDLDPKTGQCRKPGALADAQERIRDAEQRMTEIREAIVQLGRQVVEESEVKAALAAFDPLWQSLSPPEQSRLLELLVEKVVYDGAQSTLSVTFRPTGIKELAGDDTTFEEGTAA